MFKQLSDMASRLAGYSQTQPQPQTQPDVKFSLEDFEGDDLLLNDLENSATSESIDDFVDVKK